MSTPANSVSAIRDAVAALPREDWKYTDLERVVETGERWASAPDASPGLPDALIDAATRTLEADWL
ncbi:MAG: hypothetical protein R3358_15270, partial [Woeseiaceae bacterium]|nr:hypothetical protein [Woeseiaceae bacterium]